eukprot:5879587-Amphidinium_carterae.1
MNNLIIKLRMHTVTPHAGHLQDVCEGARTDTVQGLETRKKSSETPNPSRALSSSSSPVLWLVSPGFSL